MGKRQAQKRHKHRYTPRVKPIDMRQMLYEDYMNAPITNREHISRAQDFLKTTLPDEHELVIKTMYAYLELRGELTREKLKDLGGYLVASFADQAIYKEMIGD